MVTVELLPIKCLIENEVALAHLNLGVNFRSRHEQHDWDLGGIHKPLEDLVMVALVPFEKIRAWNCFDPECAGNSLHRFESGDQPVLAPPRDLMPNRSPHYARDHRGWFYQTEDANSISARQ
jgi:hypothetical protein